MPSPQLAWGFFVTLCLAMPTKSSACVRAFVFLFFSFMAGTHQCICFSCPLLLTLLRVVSHLCVGVVVLVFFCIIFFYTHSEINAFESEGKKRVYAFQPYLRNGGARTNKRTNDKFSCPCPRNEKEPRILHRGSLCLSCVLDKVRLNPP